MTTRQVSEPSDVRAAVELVIAAFGELPDEAWAVNAHRLDWTCRETAAHMLDDLGAYALQLSGDRPPQTDYLPLLDREWTPGGPPILLYPDPATGTAGILACLDATGGLLTVVTSNAPPTHRAYHPRGLSDSSGFAAMGIVEVLLHAHDILTAQDKVLTPDPGLCERVLNRLFPSADRTEDAWQDLLSASGRTPDTWDQPWTWDSTVRSDY